MNLFALFSKIYYVTKIHIILDLLFYNYLYSYKFRNLQFYNYGNLTIFTVYILLTVVMVQNWQLIYDFTNLKFLIKLNNDNIYNYNITNILRHTIKIKITITILQFYIQLQF